MTGPCLCGDTECLSCGTLQGTREQRHSEFPFDPVNKPKHYNSHPSGVECITVTRHMNFNLGNVIKYLWRAGIKTEVPLEDLKKARWYLDDEIKRLEKE